MAKIPANKKRFAAAQDWLMNRLVLASVAVLVLTAGCKSSNTHSSMGSLDWKKLPAIPDVEGFAGAFTGTSGGALIVAGGANLTSDKWNKNARKQWTDAVYILEQPDAAWRTGFKLPHPIGYGVSITTSNGVICIGGSDATQHYTDVIRLEWVKGELKVSSLPPLPRPGANFSGALVGSTIYVAGGIETPTATNALDTFWALDLSAREPRWKTLPTWPGPARMFAVAGSHNGAFYLFSGASLKADDAGKPVRTYLHDAYAFTPSQGWQQLADLPCAVTAAATPAASSAEKLLIFSGDDGANVALPQSPDHPGFSRRMLAYDVKENKWSAPGEVPFSRATTGTTLWRGHVVVPMGEVRPRERTTEVWWAQLPADDSKASR